MLVEVLIDSPFVPGGVLRITPVFLYLKNQPLLISVLSGTHKKSKCVLHW